MRRWLLVGTVGISLGLAPVPGAQAADSVLGRLTQRQHEGSARDVAAPHRAKGWSLAGTRRSRAGRAALRAIAQGPLADGRRPVRQMPNEPYVPQAGCYPEELPGVEAFRAMLLRTFPRSTRSLQNYNVVRGCNTPGISEHEEGRALDFEAHTNYRKQDAQARRLLRWLTKRGGYHARRFGIMYIIYDQHIWAQYNQRWRLMSDRGSVTANHRDHIHFTFTWNGALRRTAYWTGRSPGVHFGPCPVYRWHYAPVLVQSLARTPRTSPCGSGKRVPASWRYGDSVMYWQYGSRVWWLQQYLTESGSYTGTVTGAFGPITYQAVRRWQKAHGVPRTGVWDPASQHASRRVVGRRVDSRVYGWDASSVTAQVGDTITMPVNLHTGRDRVSRPISLVRREPGGTWITVAKGRTAANGDYVARIPVLAGDWRYRLVVPESSLARATTTFSKSVVSVR